jgi:Ino eighty subunit 2
MILLLAKVIHDNDIESEDPTSPSASEEDVSTQGGPSRSTGTPTVSIRPLTTRQAVLASMVDPSHVSLSKWFDLLTTYFRLNGNR